MQLPKRTVFVVHSMAESDVTVLSEVPAILGISHLALVVRVLVVIVQPLQVVPVVLTGSENLPVTVEVAPPLLVISHSIVDVVHESSVLPDVSLWTIEPPDGMLQSIFVPLGQDCPTGQGSAVVEQMTGAEAEAARHSAVR